jgi:SAM-dependent methyltransferase
VCGSSLSEELGPVRDSISGAEFSVIRCAGCRLGLTVPTPADLEPFYGERYYGHRHGITARLCLRRRMRILRWSTKAPGALADIGCGDGSFLLEARRAGWAVVGTEVSPTGAAPGLEIRRSIHELGPRAPFDCITLWHSLEHLGRPVEALTELTAMLAPGGTLLVAVPDSRGWQARLFGRHWLHLDVPRHLYHFGLSSLRGAFERAELEVTRVWHQELEYDLFGWIQSTLNGVMSHPNILFDALTGRARRVSRARVAANLVLAGLLAAPALAATVFSTLAGQGGTLVLAGRSRK